MCILIAMSSYLCVWLEFAVIEQPSDLWSYAQLYSNSLCTCVCVYACMHVCVCAWVHGWCHYCMLGCAALTRPNEAKTVPWVTSLLSAAPFL